MKTRTASVVLRLDVLVEQETRDEEPVAAKRLTHVRVGHLRAGGATQREAVESLLADVRALIESPAALAALEVEREGAARHSPASTCILCAGTGRHLERGDRGVVLASRACERCEGAGLAAFGG